MKYRSNDEILASLLQSAAERQTITKTKLMYSSFLSYPQLVEYLEFLTDNELLKFDKIQKSYKITSKGVELLDVYMKMKDMIKG